LEVVAAVRSAARIDADHRAGESRARVQAHWEVMSASMSEGHARLVQEAAAAGEQYVRSPDYGTPGARLLRRCLDAISRYNYAYWPYTLIPPEVMLAMPPALADVYLAHDVLPLHECEDCGVHLPYQHFKTCPLCGGHVGWYAFWQKHQDDTGDRASRGPAVGT
jgi:hypothetical protein